MIIIDYRPFELNSLAYVVENKEILDVQQISSQPMGMLEGLKILFEKYNTREVYMPNINSIMVEEMKKDYPDIKIIEEGELE